jgi:site-specific recombinase XerD
MSLFHKITTRYVNANGKRCKPSDPGARKVREESKKWYTIDPATGKPTPLCANKSAARIMAGDLIRKHELRKNGAVDPHEEHRRRPLVEHMEDFRSSLLAKGDTPLHVSQTISRIRAILDGCGFCFTTDLDALKVEKFLARLRARKDLPPLDPHKAEWRKAELAAALGIKPGTVTALVQRHRLPALGGGRTRRFPAETALALHERLSQGASAQTSNYYLLAVKSFCRWLAAEDRIAKSALGRLDPLDTATDRRHDRHELSGDELGRLLAAAKASNRTFRGLAGADRHALYVVSTSTGFRAAALSSLTPASFELDLDPPTVTLSARANKSKVLKVQPLPAGCAELLRTYLQGRDPRRPVWPGPWYTVAAQMVRRDLAEAGIDYTVVGADGVVRYRDFHAVGRHTCLTLAGRAGVPLRVLQELAGHSTSSLTERYTHVRVHDLVAAVEKLDFLPAGPDTAAAELRPTGTDDAPALPFGCQVVARTGATRGEGMTTSETEQALKGGSDTGRNPPVVRGIAAGREQMRVAAGRADEEESQSRHRITNQLVQVGNSDLRPIG